MNITYIRRCKESQLLAIRTSCTELAWTSPRVIFNSYNRGQKSWDTFVFLGRFSIHTGPVPSLTPQTMLEACIQNFFRVSTLYRVGEGRTARKFRKGCTVLKGNREMTEKYEYCSTVLRTFVQDCSSNNVWMNSVDYSSSVIWIPQKTSLSR